MKTLHDIPVPWPDTSPVQVIVRSCGAMPWQDAVNLAVSLLEVADDVEHHNKAAEQYGAYLGGYAECPAGWPTRAEVHAQHIALLEKANA